jgi:hypothetical protein
MPQRLLPERQQGQLHAGRIVVSRLRQVGPGQVGRGADGRQQVVHQRQMEHLLGGHVRDARPPALNRSELVAGQALALLEGERGIQILAHDAVLELGRLAQHVDERLSVLDDERRLRRSLPAPHRNQPRQPPLSGRRVASRATAVCHVLAVLPRPALVPGSSPTVGSATWC